MVSVFILKTIGLSENHEILWFHLRPKRLPRGFSSLIVAVIYHPHWTTGENDYMREHLLQSLVYGLSRHIQIAQSLLLVILIV